MVFQEARLFPHLSVKANLLYGRWAGGRRSDTRLESVLALLGLEGFLERRPHTLSGGEAQRVAIGRALMAAPDILLMDEPLSNLDGARRAEILPFLEKLAHEGGVPILYVSHQVDEVARLADSIVVLSEGSVVAAGPIEEVFGRYDLGAATGRHEAGAILLAEVVGEDKEFALTRLKIDGAELVVPALDRPTGARVRLRIRSQDVALALAPPENLSVRNVVPAEIVSIDMDAGAYAEVLLSAAGPVPALAHHAKIRGRARPSPRPSRLRADQEHRGRGGQAGPRVIPLRMRRPSHTLRRKTRRSRRGPCGGGRP